jgi:hypothetical protein
MVVTTGGVILDEHLHNERGPICTVQNFLTNKMASRFFSCCAEILVGSKSLRCVRERWHGTEDGNTTAVPRR